MRWRHVTVAVGLLLASASGAAADATIQDFSGAWQGVELRSSGDNKGLKFTRKDLDVQIRSDGNGFHMSWTGFSRQDGGNGSTTIFSSGNSTAATENGSNGSVATYGAGGA